MVTKVRRLWVERIERKKNEWCGHAFCCCKNFKWKLRNRVKIWEFTPSARTHDTAMLRGAKLSRNSSASNVLKKKIETLHCAPVEAKPKYSIWINQSTNTLLHSVRQVAFLFLLFWLKGQCSRLSIFFFVVVVVGLRRVRYAKWRVKINK